MIGVIADSADYGVVREFFELFKTPWEFYQKDQQYEVLICSGERQFDAGAKLTLAYAGRRVHFEDQHRVPAEPRTSHPCFLKYQGNRIPIYGDSITFAAKAGGLLVDESTQECAAYLDTSERRSLARVGYDLFAEVRTLLTVGQPPLNANIPTLELHIALLKDLIIGCGISLVEIPPVPDGFPFIACLTHDVDHPSARQHKLDHTIVGFLWRAIFGSLADTVRGWMSLRDAVKNWAAAVKLPFVYTGLARDFWSDFAERYLEVEKDLPSTFFVIPRKNYPGKGIDSRAAAFRAACYEAKELADTICRLTSAGREVGLHGIDAWLDSSAGRAELEEISRLTGVSDVGVRMHWLYYNEKSPATLEKAGAYYDSTSGYNDAVGYRAGTTQAFKPLEAKRLLELPLHAMDTALFYLSYLGLSPREASARLSQIADDVVQHGGCITINWHDRSLAPERLWGGCYRELIQDLKNRGAWFATAGQATSWFRKRRSAVFEADGAFQRSTCAKVVVRQSDNLPGLRLRVHKGRKYGECATRRTPDYVDLPLQEGIVASVPSEIGQ